MPALRVDTSMGHHRVAAVIIAPLLLAAMHGVLASEAGSDGRDPSDVGPFALDPTELDPIRFTRMSGDRTAPPAGPVEHAAHRTEFSFSLAPGRLDFSRQGAYGLGLFFADPELAVESVPAAAWHSSSIDVPAELTTGLNNGFRYSAGVRIEHEDADIDGTAYVSSSLLGLSYGRLGRLWYGGIDVNLEQFADERYGEDQPDVLKLDVTTGRRLGITGLGATSPLWLLSLQGDFDLLDARADESLESDGDWYLNPSLFWQHPGFTFSAQMQVPVDVEPSANDEAEPDYRLRAIFEKRFK